MAPRMTKSKIYSYMRNVGRSFGYAMVDSVSSMNPTVTALFKSTAEQSKDLYASIKNFDGKSLGFESDLKGTLSEGLRDLKNNALDDIRTGKWYNKDRKNAVENQMAEDMLGISFDDFGDFDDFNFDDTDLDEQASIQEDATRATVQAMDTVGSKVSGAVSTAAIKSADYIVESGRLNTKALYNLNLSGFGQVNKGVAAINGNLQLLVSLAEPLTTHMQNSALFYTKSQEYYNESLTLLKQIASNTAPKSSNSYNSSKKSKGYMDYITSEGIIDFAGMLADGGKRIKENTEMITSLMSIVPGGEKAIIKMATASPLQFALTAAIGQLFNVKDSRGRSIRSSFEDFNKVLSNFSVGLLGRMKTAKFGDGLLSPFLRGIRDFLMPNQKTIKKVDPSKYEKGKVDWDGMSRKALMDVIPTQLAQIIALLEGTNDIRVFDYNKGTFVRSSRVAGKYKVDMKNMTNKAGGDLFRYVNKSIDKTNMSTADKRAYKKQVEKLLEYAVMSDDDNFLNFLSDNFDFEKIGMDKRVGRDIQNRVKAVSKQKGGKYALSSFAGNVYSARSNVSRYHENPDSSLVSMYNGSFRPTHGSKLIDMKDEFGYSQGEYFRMIISHLSYITKNMKNLVAIPGVGGFNAEGTQIVWEDGDDITKSNHVNSTADGSSDRFKRAGEVRGPLYNDIDSSVAAAMGNDNAGLFDLTEDEKKYEASKGKPGFKFDQEMEDSIKRKKTAQKGLNKAKGFAGEAYDRLKGSKVGGILSSIEDRLEMSTENVADALDKMSEGLNRFVYDNKSGLFALMDTMSMGVLSMLKEFIPKPVRDLLGAGWQKFKDSSFGKATFGTLKNIGLSFFGKPGYRSKAESFDPDTRAATMEEYDNQMLELGFDPDERRGSGSGLVNNFYSRSRRANFWGNYSRGSFSGSASGIPTFRKVRTIPRSRSYRSRRFSGGASSTGEDAASGDEDISDASLGSFVGAIASSIGNKLMDKIAGFAEFVNPDKEKEAVKGTMQKLMEEAGLAKGAIGAGAFIGAGTSLLTGAFFGPIAGAAIGAAAGFVAKSETAQNFLFGKWDDENKEQLEKGVLPESIAKFFKQNAESTAKGAGVGMVAGAFMGSPILGAVVGATAGYIKSSEAVRKALFGEAGEDGMREGGIYSETINTIKKNINDAIAPISTEIKNNAKDVIKLVIGGISRAAAAVFHKAIASPLMSKINEKLLQPLGNVLTKGIGGLVAAPFKAIGSVGRGLRRKQIRTGRANDMTAAQRIKYRRENNLNADEFMDFDNTIASIGTEDIDSFTKQYVDLFSKAKQSKDPEQMQKALNEFSTKFGLQNVNLNENNYYKYLDTIRAEAKNRNRSPEALAKERELQRDEMIKKHYETIEDMVGNIANKILKQTVYPVKTRVADTEESESEESAPDRITTPDTRRNFRSVVKSLVNPFHGMDMESVEDAIAYYEEKTNGTRISSKFVGREEELEKMVRKVKVGGTFRDDVIQVTDINGYTVTVQNVNGSWIPYQFGKQLFNTIGDTKVGRVLKTVGTAVKGAAKIIYHLVVDKPFANLNADDVDKITNIYLFKKYPGRSNLKSISPEDEQFFNDHCTVQDAAYPGENVITITDRDGNIGVGRYDEESWHWKKLGLFFKAGQSVKRLGRSIRAGFNGVKNTIKSITNEMRKHINPFCDFKDPKELDEIIESLNNMEFNGGHDETGKIHQIEGLDHYYTIITSDASTTVTNQGGRWVYVSNKALEAAKAKRIVAGIGGAITGGIKNLFHKITGKRSDNRARAEQRRINDVFNRQKEAESEELGEGGYESIFENQYDDEDDGGRGSGLIKRLGFAGRGFIDDPSAEQDENASNKLRKKRKEREGFLSSIASLPMLGSGISKLNKTANAILKQLGGGEGEKKKSLFDKIKDALLGENGLLGGLFGFFTGNSGIGGVVGKLLGKLGTFGTTLKSLLPGIIGSAIAVSGLKAAFEGKFDELANKIDNNYMDSSRQGDDLVDENGNLVTAETDPETGETTYKDKDGNEVDPSEVKVANADETQTFSEKLKSKTIRNAISGRKSLTSVVAKGVYKSTLGKSKTVASIVKATTTAAAGDMAAMSVLKTSIANGLQKLPNLISKIPGIGPKLAPVAENIAGAIGKLCNSALNGGVKAAKLGNLLKKVGVIITVALFAVDFSTGYQDAESILGVAEPTDGERIVSGLIKAIKNLIPIVDLIPTATVAKVLIDYVAPVFGIDTTSLKQRQDEAEQELERINAEAAANGEETYDSWADYQKRGLGNYTWTEKVSNGVKSWWNGATSSSVKTDNSGKQYTETAYGRKYIDNGSSGGASGVINQFDRKYNKLRVGGRSFANNGCGPASAVMAMGGNLNNAVRIAQKYQTSGGTDAAYFGEMFNRNGMSANYYLAGGSSLIGDIASGKPTVLMGQDIKNRSKANSPFGPNNHYVVANGFDRAGNLIISDPEQGGIRKYNPNILRNVKVGISGGTPMYAGLNPNNPAYQQQTPAMNYTSGAFAAPAKSAQNYSSGAFAAPKTTSKSSSYNDLKAEVGRKESIAQKSGKDLSSVGLGSPTSGVSNVPMTAENCANGNLGMWSPVTAEEMNSWIASKSSDSPFNGNGEIFIKAAQASGLDPRYILAHAAVESGWGKSNIALTKNNYFGIGAFDTNPNAAYTFAAGASNDGLATGIIEGAKWIADHYYKGKYNQTSVYRMRYNNGVHQYCTSETWVGSIGSIMASGPVNTKLTLDDTPVSLVQNSVDYSTSDVGDNPDGAVESGAKNKVSLGGILSTITSAFANAFGALFNGSSEDGETEHGGSHGTFGEDSGSVNLSGSDPVSYMEGIKGKVKYTFGSHDIENGKGDCSGTVGWAVNKATGLNIGGTTLDMYNNTKNLKSVWYQGGKTSASAPSGAKRNDILLFSRPNSDYTVGRPDRVGHVGLYMGDNKYIHIGKGTGPYESSLNESANLIKVSRLIDDNGNEINFTGDQEVNYQGVPGVTSVQEVYDPTTKSVKKSTAVKSGNKFGPTKITEAAAGSGLINYGPSRAGNYILNDTSRNYYKQSGSGSGLSGGASNISFGNLMATARDTVRNVSNSAKQRGKDSLSVPTNVASIASDTSDIKKSIAAIAEVLTTMQDAKQNTSTQTNASTSRFTDELADSLNELKDVTNSITAV